MANRFWVAGTETWNSTAGAKWGTLSGVADSASLPGTGDVAIFDSLSGGGTVTVDSPNGAGIVTVQQITMGAFTGTLDFAMHDNNVTLSVALSGTGTGVRTLNMGNGTWTITGAASTVFDFGTVTNLTFNSNSSKVLLQATPTSQRFVNLGTSLIHNEISINDIGTARPPLDFANPATITTLTLTKANFLRLQSSVTFIVTNAFSGAGGDSTTQTSLESTSSAAATLSVGGACTLNWAAIRGITKAGAGSITAINSFNLGNVNGISISAPGGARVIGG